MSNLWWNGTDGYITVIGGEPLTVAEEVVYWPQAIAIAKHAAETAQTAKDRTWQ